jgi:O-antigen biosynthesis protein
MKSEHSRNTRQKVLDRFLPWGTSRRYYFELGRSGIIVIRTEGVGSFCLRARPFVESWFPRWSGNKYQAWFSKNEPDSEALALQKDQSRAFEYRPRISIITPVWNTDEKWLRLCIGSVISQTYDNWELCIANGGSTRSYIRSVLDEYSQSDTRIKVRYLSENKGISANSNEALSMATGEFIALLDHDDELSPFALYECVKVLNEKPETDFIYSDEDKINQKGKRSFPAFKPDWSPDLFLSCNYTCHLGVYRKKIVDAIGGFRPGYDGSQDYDLVLRFIEKSSNIAHIPKVLYHWRALMESAATHSLAKPYTHLAASRALSDYIARNHIAGTVMDGPSPGLFRVKRDIIDNPLVSIIIPTRDHLKLIKNCIGSILDKTEYSNYEIIIVDNGSIDPSIKSYYTHLVENPRVKVLNYDHPFNFSSINNFAIKQAQGKHLLFLNDDTEVISPEWLTAMLEHSQRKEVGAVGALLLYPSGAIQHCGVIIGAGADGIASHAFYRAPEYFGYMNRIKIINNYSAVTGACLMLKKSLFEELGGLDDRLPSNYNDIDLCLKIKGKGFLIVYTPYARLYHLESFSRGHLDTPDKRSKTSQDVELFKDCWADLLKQGDPYYNPNLKLMAADFTIG